MTKYRVKVRKNSQMIHYFRIFLFKVFEFANNYRIRLTLRLNPKLDLVIG